MKRSRLAIFVGVPIALVILLVAAHAVQRAHQLKPRDIPILMYHNVLPADEANSVWKVSVEEFRRQMDDLRDAGFQTILPDDIRRASRGWGWLPPKPVVITFDDGYEGVMRHAEPILRDHGFRGICYVIVNRLGADGEPRPVFDSGPLLTTNEVAAMAARGTVAIGVHSLSHRNDPKRLAAEARVGRYELRKRTGIKSRSYCYPFGMYRQPFMREAVEDARYRTALICEDQMFHYTPDADWFAIPRLSVYGGPHDIRVEAVDFAKGTVKVSNNGRELPLKAVMRDPATGRMSESPAVRVGPKTRTLRVEGAGFPPNAEVELLDAAGLFRYDPDLP
jgi:peptidoglycan/xylan/chitin deacetylase (PgdA/CDA1 family)